MEEMHELFDDMHEGEHKRGEERRGREGGW